jgi:peptidoglycan hydrolase-like protein with peptidoglycan-binding domain
MKIKMKKLLVPSVILGFALMLMNVPTASAQQQVATAEKTAVKQMESQMQTMPSAKTEAKMPMSTAQGEKAASTMMKSTSKMSVMSNQEIKSVQEALNKDGYKLTADGMMGNHTVSAIKDFQKKNDLKVTGLPDSETLAKLNLK